MKEKSNPSRILVVDDHPLVREGFTSVLSSQEDMEIVGQAADGLEAIELSKRVRPEVVLMDLSMPKMDGIEATRALKECCPQSVVLMLTAYASEELMIKAIRAGAAGYLLKGTHPSELVGSVREVLDGESPMDQKLSAKLLMRLLASEEGMDTTSITSTNRLPSQAASEEGEGEEGARGGFVPSLSGREREVLGHVLSGKTNRQIAQELHFSLSTVKRHLERINHKLGVSDRTQAVVKAIELGLLPARKER